MKSPTPLLLFVGIFFAGLAEGQQVPTGDELRVPASQNSHDSDDQTGGASSSGIPEDTSSSTPTDEPSSSAPSNAQSTSAPSVCPLSNKPGDTLLSNIEEELKAITDDILKPVSRQGSTCPGVCRDELAPACRRECGRRGAPLAVCRLVCHSHELRCCRCPLGCHGPFVRCYGACRERDTACKDSCVSRASSCCDRKGGES